MRDRLSKALGADVTQLRDLLVSAKSVASIFASSPTRSIGGDLDDDCQGFAQPTAEESENTVTRPVRRPPAVAFNTAAQEAGTGYYYYTPGGQKVSPQAVVDTKARYLNRWGDDSWDVAPSTQASFI